MPNFDKKCQLVQGRCCGSMSYDSILLVVIGKWLIGILYLETRIWSMVNLAPRNLHPTTRLKNELIISWKY